LYSTDCRFGGFACLFSVLSFDDCVMTSFNRIAEYGNFCAIAMPSLIVL
jgi:hypothetical protein